MTSGRLTPETKPVPATHCGRGCYSASASSVVSRAFGCSPRSHQQGLAATIHVMSYVTEYDNDDGGSVQQLYQWQLLALVCPAR